MPLYLNAIKQLPEDVQLELTESFSNARLIEELTERIICLKYELQLKDEKYDRLSYLYNPHFSHIS